MADLLSRQVALIVGNTPAALAAKAATTTVPIVFASGGDPVRDGLVANLNRPGGNVTGVSFVSHKLAAKQLGLLRELRPGAVRIAVLVDAKWPLTEPFVSQVRAAASAMGQQIDVLYVNSDREIESAFTTLIQSGALLLESWFRPPWMKELDEAGIPLPLAERLAPFVGDPAGRAEAVDTIRNLSILQTLRHFDAIDAFILDLALSVR